MTEHNTHAPPAPPTTPRWAWSFLLIVAAAVFGTVAIHAMRLPTGARGHYNRGMLDSREGRFESAIRNLDRALEIDPAMTVARVGRAMVWNRAGKPFRALADANLAIESEPSSRGFYARGVAFKKLGRLDEAIRDLTAAFGGDRGYGRPVLALGDALVEAGRYDEALSAYRDAAALRSHDDAMFIAPMLIWETRTLLGDGAGADAELRERVEAVRADETRLALWVPPVDSADVAVASWARAVTALAGKDRHGAVKALRASLDAAAPDAWVRDRARGLLLSAALGFRVQPDDREISSSFSFGPGSTVVWVRAGEADLVNGDRALRIGGVEATPEAMDEIAAHAPVGSSVSIELMRKGHPATVTIAIGGGAEVRPGSSAPTR